MAEPSPVGRRAGAGTAALWAACAVAGGCAGLGAVLLFTASNALQDVLVGADDAMFVSAAADIPSWRIVAVPTVGGLIVGLLLQLCVRFGLIEHLRPGGIAEVIDAQVSPQGRLDARTGLASGVLSTLSLGVGASTGREGPVVHLGACLAAIFRKLTADDPRDRRILLAAGAGAAVSAAFNAPIAGMLFAHEVILRHYALRAFGPIAVASVAGGLVSRSLLGPTPSFDPPDYEAPALIEIAGALPLGLVCGILTAAFLFAVSTACTRWDRWTAARAIPLSVGPPLAGLIVGLAALLAPHVFGVGYETIDMALHGELPWLGCLLVIALKLVTAPACLAGRFGGGVVAPSFVLGACLGAAVAQILSGFGFDIAGSGFYAVIAMGAVAGATLGAPISTSLLIFELTGDYPMTIALMLAVAASVAACRALFGRSYIHWQLTRRGIDIGQGRARLLRRQITVADVAEAAPGEGEPVSEDEPHVTSEDTLETALTLMGRHELDEVPVCGTRDGTPVLIGRLRLAAALRRYNEALIAADEEEHH